MELVDGPKDIKMEITSRAMARETFLWEKEQNRLKSLGLKNDLEGKRNPLSISQNVSENQNQDQNQDQTTTTTTEETSSTNPDEENSKALLSLSKDTRFGSLTRKSIQQISAFKGIENLSKLISMASNHLERLKAIEELEGNPISSSSSPSIDRERLTELMKSGNGPRGINDSKSLDDKLKNLEFGSKVLKGKERKLKAGMNLEEEHYENGGNLKGLGKRKVGRGEGRKSVLKVARGVFVKRQWRGSNELLVGRNEKSQSRKELSP